MGAVNVGRYERQLFYGNAGSMAATQVLGLIDDDFETPHDYDRTDARGDGTSIPIESEQPVLRKANFKFKLRYKKGDAAVLALLAIAKHASAPVIALKLVSYPSGPTLFDGDVTLDVSDPNSRELEFTAHVSVEGGRAPTF